MSSKTGACAPAWRELWSWYLSSANPTTKFFAVDTLDAAVVDPATADQPAEMFPQPFDASDWDQFWDSDVQLMQNGEVSPPELPTSSCVVATLRHVLLFSAFNTNTPLFTWDSAYRWRFALRASQ